MMLLWLKAGEAGKLELSLQRLPEWPSTEQWGSVGRMVVDWATPVDCPELQKAAEVTPHQVEAMLTQLRLGHRPGAEKTAVGEASWLFLTALHTLDDEILHLHRMLSGKEQECREMGGHSELRRLSLEATTTRTEALLPRKWLDITC